MPVVSVSLSEVGWEGYKALPRGKRSRIIDKMLREYALDRIRMTAPHEEKGYLTVAEVLERQTYLQTTLDTVMTENKRLKEVTSNDS